jgi:hypothetical protein
MDLLEALGISRVAGLGYAVVGLGLALLLAIRLLVRRSRTGERIQVRLNERE